MQWVPHSESDGASGIDKLANVAVGQTAPSAVPPPDAGYPFVVDPSQLGQMGMHHQWGAPHGDDSFVYNPSAYPQQHTPQSDASDSTRPRRPSVRMIAGAQALQGLAQALAESSHPEQSTPTGHQYSESKPQKSRANSRLTPTEEQISPVSESGSAAESRTAKAKETHRQAEQRRRQQQIDAATELKKVCFACFFSMESLTSLCAAVVRSCGCMREPHLVSHSPTHRSTSTNCGKPRPTF